MKNVMVFGGTGMLLETTKWLTNESDQLIVFGRDAHKIGWLSGQDGENGFSFKELNYQNNEQLRKRVIESNQEFGDIDCVVAWIHSTAPEALRIIMGELEQRQKKRYRLFHIKGSSSSQVPLEKRLIHSSHCLYHEIILGFDVDGITSRWLTLDEISTGVIDAIRNEQVSSIIGTVTPWESRPK